MRALLADAVDVDARQPDGATALHWAMHRESEEIADLLIRAGADVDAANDLGVTPAPDGERARTRGPSSSACARPAPIRTRRSRAVRRR